MPQSTTALREEFDGLAMLSCDGWNHNAHYHPFLLKHVPPCCGHVLESAAAPSAFSRLLAARARHLPALDLSPSSVLCTFDHEGDASG